MGSTPTAGSTKKYMSKLQRHQQKKYRSQIIGYLFLLVIIIIFIATIGVKLLISASLFVINHTPKNNKTQDSGETATDLILPPEIFNAPTATNTAEIVLQIRSTPKKNLSFYINDVKQKEIIPEEETFETTITLEKGNNTVSMIMDDPTSKTKKTSREYTIIYKDEKPALEITSPRDLDTTSKNEILIEGNTESEVIIHINNLPIIVDSEGKFSYSLRLKEGENHITIEAIDIADNYETKAITVYYQKEN